MTATPDTRPAPGPATAPAPATPSPATPTPADAIPAATAPTATTAGGLPPRSDAVLASDAEREYVTARLRTAAAE
ncbi:hypothetical protein, partial [Pseudonocardia sp. SID8383]